MQKINTEKSPPASSLCLERAVDLLCILDTRLRKESTKQFENGLVSLIRDYGGKVSGTQDQAHCSDLATTWMSKLPPIRGARRHKGLEGEVRFWAANIRSNDPVARYLGSIGPNLVPALYLTRAIMEFLRLYSKDTLETMIAKRQFLPLIVRFANWSEFEKNAKNFLLTPVASFYERRDEKGRNNYMVLPDSDPLRRSVSGSVLRQYLFRLVHQNGRKALEALTSFYQLKRACRPVDDSFIASTYEDHRKSMIKEPPLNNRVLLQPGEFTDNLAMRTACEEVARLFFKPSTYEGISLKEGDHKESGKKELFDENAEIYSLLTAISRDQGFTKTVERPWQLRMNSKLDQIFEGIIWDHTHKVYEISHSACFESSKSNGGAHDYLIQSYHGNYRDSHDYIPTNLDPCVTRPDYVLKVVLDSGLPRGRYNHTPNSVGSPLVSFVIAGTYPELLNMDYSPRSGVIENHGYPSIRLVDGVAKLNQSYRHVKKTALTASVYGVMEPLKVRTITKGNALQYHLARGLQKDLHGHLRNIPIFRLIGRPLEPGDISDIVKSGSGSFVSGDYKGATDSVRIDASRIVMDYVLNKVRAFAGDRFLSVSMEESFLNAMRSVLDLHCIRYPKRFEIPDAEQRNGQLMGSVLSFPVLCVINCMTYWFALEDKKGCDIPFSEILPSVLVNGDDILFRAEPDLYELWKRWANIFGFQLSLGKNYVDKRYCMINTQTFDTRKEVTRIDYYNVGLLTGQSKVSGKVDTDEPDKVLAGVSACHNECIRGHKQQSLISERFCHYHKEQIEKLTAGGRYALYMPAVLGGADFDRPLDGSSDQCRLTRRQIILADRLNQAWNITKPRYQPPPLLGLKIHKTFTWKTVDEGVYWYWMQSACKPLTSRQERPREKDTGPANWCVSEEARYSAIGHLRGNVEKRIFGSKIQYHYQHALPVNPIVIRSKDLPMPLPHVTEVPSASRYVDALSDAEVQYMETIKAYRSLYSKYDTLWYRRTYLGKIGSPSWDSEVISVNHKIDEMGHDIDSWERELSDLRKVIKRLKHLSVHPE